MKAELSMFVISKHSDLCELLRVFIQLVDGVVADCLMGLIHALFAKLSSNFAVISIIIAVSIGISFWSSCKPHIEWIQIRLRVQCVKIWVFSHLRNLVSWCTNSLPISISYKSVTHPWSVFFKLILVINEHIVLVLLIHRQAFIALILIGFIRDYSTLLETCLWLSVWTSVLVPIFLIH